MHPVIYSTSELLYQIKQACQVHLGWVAVRGEISNFKVPRSGHFYFRLKDQKGALDAVMFRTEQENLYFVPKNGMEVVCWGLCVVYAPQGRLQLSVELMERVGQGVQSYAFEKLKLKLEQEGLFDPSIKKKLPFLPRRIALITSPTGAAIQDLLHVLQRRLPSCSLLFAPCQVQGVGAAERISKTIDHVSQISGVDLIILGRGGGSSEDLWPFNEEVVARSIAACQIPILTGVGHETDTTIADLVADASAPTPSAAAEVAVPEEDLLHQRLVLVQRRLELAMLHVISSKKSQLDLLSQQLKPPQMQLYARRQRLKEYQERLERVMIESLMKSRRELGKMGMRLDDLSPLRVLQRGYALVHDQDEHLVYDATALKVGEMLRLSLQKGRVQVEVTKLEEE